jgi:hypothetical protein
MKARKLIVFALMSILLLSTWACGASGGTSTTTGVSSEQIAEALRAAGTGIDTYQTYQFDADIDMTITGEMYATVTMQMNGAVNEADRKMYADMQMSMLMPEPMDMDMEMYLAGGWVYMKMEIPDMPPEMSAWMKVQMPEDYWEQQDIGSQQLDLLTDFVEVELLGTEMVSGVECYKLRVTPDVGKLWAWAQMQAGMEELELDLDLGFDFEDVVNDFSILQWVATDTYFPLKSIVDMTMTIEAETIDMDMTMLMHDINQPVKIELPTAAQEAEEVFMQ